MSVRRTIPMNSCAFNAFLYAFETHKKVSKEFFGGNLKSQCKFCCLAEEFGDFFSSVFEERFREMKRGCSLSLAQFSLSPAFLVTISSLFFSALKTRWKSMSFPFYRVIEKYFYHHNTIFFHFQLHSNAINIFIAVVVVVVMHKLFVDLHVNS